MRKWLADSLEKVFLLRVPVIGWLLIAAVGPLASATPIGSGLFYVDGEFLRMLFISLAAFLASAACLVSFHLIRWGAEYRFGVSMRTQHPGLWFAIAHAAPLLLLFYVVRSTNSNWPLWRSLATAVGWAAPGWVLAGVVIAVSTLGYL